MDTSFDLVAAVSAAAAVAPASSANYNAGGKYSSTKPARTPGVSWHESKKSFRVQITIEGRLKTIGSYPTWEGACLAHDRKARELHNEAIFNTGTKTTFTLAEFNERMEGCGGQILTVGEIAATKKTSKYVGVSWYTRTSKWKAAYRLNDAKHFIGLYDDEDEAADAYDDVMQSLQDESEASNKLHFQKALTAFKADPRFFFLWKQNALTVTGQAFAEERRQDPKTKELQAVLDSWRWVVFASGPRLWLSYHLRKILLYIISKTLRR